MTPTEIQTIPLEISKLFLQKQFTEAHSQCITTLESLRPQLSTTLSKQDEFTLQNTFKLLLLLLLRIATEVDLNELNLEEGGDDAEPEEWIYVRDVYEDEIPSDILAVGVLLLLRRKQVKQAQSAIESHILKLSDDYIQNVQNGTYPDNLNYERIVELYVLHVLAKLKEWELAKEFLENCFLSEDKKEVYLEKLEAVKEKARLKALKRVEFTPSESAVENGVIENGEEVVVDDDTTCTEEKTGKEAIKSTPHSITINPKSVINQMKLSVKQLSIVGVSGFVLIILGIIFARRGGNKPAKQGSSVGSRVLKSLGAMIRSAIL